MDGNMKQTEYSEGVTSWGIKRRREHKSVNEKGFQQEEKEWNTVVPLVN